MDKSLFFMATDDTSRREFREKLQALCADAKERRIRLDVVADELLAQACFMEVTSYDGKRWIDRAIASLNRTRIFNGVFTDEVKKRIQDSSSVHADR